MWKNLSNYRDGALLFLRIVLGTFYIWVHGWPKLAGGLPRWKQLGGAMKFVGLDFWPGFWGFLAAFSESIGCALIVVGLMFRPSCLLLAITMAVASRFEFATASGSSWAAASHPIELMLVFITLIFIGPGKFSADQG